MSQESRQQQPSSTNDAHGDDDESLSANQLYLRSNNSKKVLFLMAIGLKADGGEALVDLDFPLWKSTFKKRESKVQRGEYVQEVLRRATILKLSKIPLCRNWPVASSTKFLERNPIQDPADILFLKTEIRRFEGLFHAAEEEERNDGTRDAASWRGNVPYLRLIMCLIDDDVKEAYLHRADAITRQQLDARNSESRAPTAFELLASKWNDSDFNPTAPASTCHFDYFDATDCSHSQVEMMTPATAEKVEKILTTVRSHLLRMIQNWETSGQGEGGHDGDHTDTMEGMEIFRPDEDRFGSLTGRSEAALQNRESFLRGKPSYLLYFWELADEHQLLQSALQRLCVDVSASDAESAPSVTSSLASRNRRKRDGDTMSGEDREQFLLLRKSTESIDALSSALTRSVASMNTGENSRRVRRRIEELEDRAQNYRIKLAELGDPSMPLSQAYEREVNAIASKIAELEQQEHDISFSTLQRRNTTPSTSS